MVRDPKRISLKLDAPFLEKSRLKPSYESGYKTKSATAFPEYHNSNISNSMAMSSNTANKLSRVEEEQ